jgi:hypothetical protein
MVLIVKRHRVAPLSELIGAYGATLVEITDSSILIRINRVYRPAMDPNALYEATRGSWRVGVRRGKAKLAMAEYEGVVRAVYEIVAWQEFQDRYVGRSVGAYLRRGLQSPIAYVECR